MKFGVREICDVVLKAKATQKVGNKIFYKHEPVIYQLGGGSAGMIADDHGFCLEHVTLRQGGLLTLVFLGTVPTDQRVRLVYKDEERGFVIVIGQILGITDLGEIGQERVLLPNGGVGLLQLVRAVLPDDPMLSEESEAQKQNHEPSRQRNCQCHPDRAFHFHSEHEKPEKHKYKNF